MRTVAVLGAGSWGTALAVLWSKRGNAITLWGNNPERTAQLRATRENSEYLPGIKLPDAIRVTSDIADCSSADLIVFVTPSVVFRSVAKRLQATNLNSSAILLSGTKGIEHGTGMRMTEVLHEIFPDHTVAVLSGPNLAVEISRDLPTAAVLGCRNHECAEELPAKSAPKARKVRLAASAAGRRLDTTEPLGSDRRQRIPFVARGRSI